MAAIEYRLHVKMARSRAGGNRAAQARKACAKKVAIAPILCWHGCARDVDKPRDVLIVQVKIRLLKI